MALYTTAGSPDVRVVSKDVRKEMKCNVELWPYQYMMHQIKGGNDKVYSFDVYVEALPSHETEAKSKQSGVNEVATYLCHPFNIACGRIVCGDALILPLDETVDYTLEDYTAMRDGVWVKEDESNIDLVEENIEGMKAVYRLLSEEQKADFLMKSLEASA